MTLVTKVQRGCMVWILLSAFIISGSASAQNPRSDLPWEVIVPGIEYAKIHLPDPNNVFVARMERSNLSVTLESTIANGILSEGTESVSGMYSRYNQALNYWGGGANPPTWGMRNQSVVAINGSYFDWGSGLPQGGQVQSGWYAKRYEDFGGWSGFAWKLDRSAFIGECVYHRPDKQLITFPASGATQQITKINNPRGSDELVLFTPQWDSRTGTDNSGVEVQVEMARPTMILPAPSYASGIVRKIYNGLGNNWIPFNTILLSASGTAAQTLLENVHEGGEIRVSQEIVSYENDCATPNTLSWTKTYASIQGAFFFLDNGVIHDFNDPGAIDRNPRTAIAINDQYIYFIVVDGRDIHLSFGMTIHELGVFTRDILGATWGVAQDGGGSSTMVIGGKVVNNTFCNIYSCAGEYVNYLPVVSSNHNVGLAAPLKQNDIIFSEAGVERPVANGMLMIVALPEAISSTFHPGDPVTTLIDTPSRLGPGTNYASTSTIPGGSPGTVLPQSNGINGVGARGDYWWYTSFNGISGWVPESSLATP